nr:copper resistance CopC family protein [Kineosporia mesophila]
MAHDQLDETNPADGSTVETVPDEIVLDFSATPLALGSAVRVVGPGGDITSGKPKVVDNQVTQEVSAGRPAGDYTVQWRVTSSDGHPISGEFSFTAREGDEVSTASPETSSAVTGTSEAAATGTTVASAQNESDDGGTSPVLIITLLVLAVVVIGAVAYLFVLAPKRSSEN